MGTASVRTALAVSVSGSAARASGSGVVDLDREGPAVAAAFPARPVLVLVGADGARPGARESARDGARVCSVVLIGTRRALEGLEAQVGDRPSVRVAGRVVCDSVGRGAGGGAAGGRALLSGADRWTASALDAALDTLRPDAAIVSLPSGSMGLVEAVERALEARAIPHRRVPVLDDVLESLRGGGEGNEGAAERGRGSAGRSVSQASSASQTSSASSGRVGRVPGWRSTQAGGAGGAGAAGGGSGTDSVRAEREAAAGGGHSGVLVPRVIDYAALIGRVPYEPDRAAVGRILTGKRVLITGAGGSIGSELARVACGFAPAEIVLMERAENALFEIDRQVRSRWPGVSRRAVLHDVVDAERTARMLREMRPDVVFHAAAHKHVPLMEDHPAHAVVNNLLGTKAIADAAAACGAERFVMISSDKAVNPTSVMGATKRMAELYVRWLGTRADARGTRMSMVRFGNVLGSAASVLTIWGTQLAEGGPLTVTDPRMTRYFMTIPEAATLVIQSAALEPGSGAGGGGNGGSGAGAGMYVLDMGQPIRILDLAARFARAHGLRVRVDAGSAARSAMAAGPDGAGGSARREIERDLERWLAANGAAEESASAAVDLVFTGIRPGEKLHEELAYAAELLRPTDHPGVRAWAGEGALADVEGMVREMSALCREEDAGRVVEAIRRHVPEMRPPGGRG